MNNQRKITLKLGAGIVTLLGAAIAIACAHDVSTLRAGRIIQRVSYGTYEYTVREAPLRPDEPIRNDGTFASGYYYTCSVLRDGFPISSYTVSPRLGYKADSVKVVPLVQVRRKAMMTCFDFEGVKPDYYEVICRYVAPDQTNLTGEFRWQVAASDGSGLSS